MIRIPFPSELYASGLLQGEPFKYMVDTDDNIVDHPRITCSQIPVMAVSKKLLDNWTMEDFIK